MMLTMQASSRCVPTVERLKQLTRSRWDFGRGKDCMAANLHPG